MSSTIPDTTQPGLGGTATRAFGWSFLNAGLARFGTLALGVVLARLLGPDQFGTFAVAVVVLMAVLSFNELGVSLAIVRWEGDPAEISATVNTISVAASFLLFGLMYVTAPAVATAMGSADATGVVRLLSVSVVFSGAVAAPAALLQRDFKQRRRLVVDQAMVWVGAGLSLVLALGGLGAWSLAIGRVAATFLGLVLFIAWSPVPYRFAWNRDVARRLLHFGVPLAGASVLVFAVGYLEQVVVGATLGVTALGVYVLAYNVASWPSSMFSQPLRMVAPAAFSRMQGDLRRMNDSFGRVQQILAIVVLPLCLCLSAASTSVVQFLYGDQWAASAPVLRYLALLAALRIFFELAYDFLVVRRRTSGLFAVQLLWLAALVPTLWWCAHHWGVVGVAAGQLVMVVLVVAPFYARELHVAGVSLLLAARRLLLPVVVASAAGVLVMLVDDAVSRAWVVCLATGVICLSAWSVMLAPRRAELADLGLRRGLPGVDDEQ